MLSEICRNTFNNCKSLETLDIPNTVKRVEMDAWGGWSCEDLKKMNISDDLIASLKKDICAQLVRKGDKWEIETKPKVRNFEGFSF